MTDATGKRLAEWLVPHATHQMGEWLPAREGGKARRCLACGAYEVEHPDRGQGASDDLIRECSPANREARSGRHVEVELEYRGMSVQE